MRTGPENQEVSQAREAQTEYEEAARLLRRLRTTPTATMAELHQAEARIRIAGTRLRETSRRLRLARGAPP